MQSSKMKVAESELFISRKMKLPHKTELHISSKEIYQTSNIESKSDKVKCRICGLINSNPYSLTVHMRRHQEERPIKCKYCPRTFVLNYELSQHVNICHIKEEKYKCSLCPKKFIQLSTKYSHEDTHCILKHKCNFCKEVFNSRVQRRVHHKTHVSNSVLSVKCTRCNKMFSDQKYLETHFKNVHASNWKCKECEFMFTHPFDSTEHQKQTGHWGSSYITKLKKGQYETSNEVDPNKVVKRTCEDFYQDNDIKIKCYIFHCTVCKEKFDLRINLDAHMDRKHPNQKVQANIPCTICFKIYNNINSLQHHIISHGPKKHKCSQCEYSSVRKGDLRSHIENNHNKQVYNCNLCMKTFKSKSLFTQHKIKHADMKFKCKECQSIFKSRNSLWRHLKYTHDTVKVICSECEKIFANYQSLSIHNRRSHNHQSSLCHCKNCGTSLKLKYIKKHLSLCSKSLNLSKKSFTADNFTCAKCNIVFSTVSGIKCHYKEMHPDIFYPCTICWRYFHTEDNLQNHLEHHGNKICPTIISKPPIKTLYRKYQKKKMRTRNVHINDKFYECFACGLVFSLQSHWKMHMENSCSIKISNKSTFDIQYKEIDIFTIIKVDKDHNLLKKQIL